MKHETSRILRQDLPLVVGKVIDCIIMHTCKREFFERNAPASLAYWADLFQGLAVLLPLSSTRELPVFSADLMARTSEHDTLEFWKLAEAVHRILPTIVLQSVDMEEREACRASLAATVQAALDYAEGYDLEAADSERRKWHDSYSWIVDECREYCELFPEDTIDGWEELEAMFEKYPREGPEPDGDDEDRSVWRSNLLADQHQIEEIFSDL
jgi:hypothetical protein